MRALHKIFNGRPDLLRDALALMFEMRLSANTIVSTPLGDTGFTAAPTFEYTPNPI